MSNTWKDITLYEFTQIRKIMDGEGSEEDKRVSLAALLQGVDEETILTMPLAEVGEVFDMVEGLNQAPQPSKVRKGYHVGRWQLQLVEQKEISVAQWIDFQNYVKDGGIENHMADILSLALIPIGKRYNEGYDIEALKQDLLHQMTVGDGLAVCFFFRRRSLKSMRRILNYLVGKTIFKRGKAWKQIRQRALKLRADLASLC